MTTRLCAVRSHTRKLPAKPTRPAKFYDMAARLAKECGYKFRVKALRASVGRRV